VVQEGSPLIFERLHKEGRISRVRGWALKKRGGIEMKSTKNRLSTRGTLARTILILPSNPERKVITLSIRPFLWVFLCAVLFALPILAGSGLWSLYHFKKVNAQTQHLETENQAFRSELAEQKEKVDHLSHELFKIREKAGFIKDFLGLKSDGGHEGTMGQGGIELSPKTYQPRSDLSSPDQNVLASAGGLAPGGTRSMDIQLLNRDLEKIISTLQDRQERLDSMPSISPVDPGQAWLSSAYGMRTSPFTGKKQFHPGVDLAGSKGTPIFAPAQGQVAFVGKNGSLGLAIEIKHDSTFKTTYGHLFKSEVKKGQKVERGDIIGYMGDTGRTTGYHLHYEIEKNGKRVNPADYMMDWGQNDTLLAGE
jgi:murein DD-endopeptidase MepM/ murein hydrolase activator NlpD